jgi:hypothetical protein
MWGGSLKLREIRGRCSADLDESEDVGTMEPAMDEMMEAVPDGSQVNDDGKR